MLGSGDTMMKKGGLSPQGTCVPEKPVWKSQPGVRKVPGRAGTKQINVVLSSRKSRFNEEDKLPGSGSPPGTLGLDRLAGAIPVGDDRFQRRQITAEPAGVSLLIRMSPEVLTLGTQLTHHHHLHPNDKLGSFRRRKR